MASRCCVDDNVLTESCWNVHSGVKWAGGWVNVVPLCFCTLCLDSCHPPGCISPLYTVSLFLFSSVRMLLFYPVSPFPLPFFSSPVYGKGFSLFLLLCSFVFLLHHHHFLLPLPASLCDRSQLSHRCVKITGWPSDTLTPQSLGSGLCNIIMWTDRHFSEEGEEWGTCMCKYIRTSSARGP